MDLPLCSTDGHVVKIRKLPVVYVASCPYNLFPPQLLIKEMKRKNFKIKHFKHDDTEYVFEYIHANDKFAKQKTIRCPIRENRLLKLRTKDGFSKFLKRTKSTHQKGYAMRVRLGDQSPFQRQRELQRDKTGEPKFQQNKTREHEF